MQEGHRRGAEQLRSRIARGELAPSAFQAALLAVPPLDRDAWLDRVLGIDEIPDDGPDLPRGCVPYIPCAVDTLLRLARQAEVEAADVFVDIGAGLGRSAVLMHLLTGAAAIGIEIQPGLVQAARALMSGLNVSGVSVIEGDAARITGTITRGTVFFLYCPFSGERLEQVLDDIEPIARTRPIRICSVDLRLPFRPWLRADLPHSGHCGDLSVHRSTGF